MRALVYGTKTQPFDVPATATSQLSQALATTPCALKEIPDAQPLRPDWYVTRPLLTGICGSDAKQILLDFEGDTDSAMSGLCSFPQVMGHEVVAEVVAAGPEAEGFDVGQRVVLNPWLSCAPRGISPVCPSCEAGDYSLCWSFNEGDLSNGIHTGVSSDATGGYAELMPAHSSMLFAVPDNVDNEHAIFAVSDTGLGIAADHIPRLTERFYRVDRSRSRDTGGTGLGLAIVKHVCATHGGEVTVWSQPGYGATFTMRLPAAAVEPTDVPEPAGSTPTTEEVRG